VGAGYRSGARFSTTSGSTQARKGSPSPTRAWTRSARGSSRSWKPATSPRKRRSAPR
jgi:hypothetical protein